MDSEVAKNEEEQVKAQSTEDAVETLEEQADRETLASDSSGNESEVAQISVKELADLEEFKSKYYYLAAELENLRKRHQRELDNLLKYGNEKVLGDLLEVVDNLERTLGAIAGDEDEKVKNIFIGIEMVNKQFYEALTKHGLTPIESIGKPFDPNFHEAMSTVEEEGKESSVVVQEYQKGWMLNGRLLRAAKVIVTK